ncbi:hypothetical protein [Pelotomaculum propionicicum]|uniref:Uncharacterized protein n=1 Tax=Pelotomaculum propionicicum TaxID=258475 RepID=A0A4Y7RTK1_9FIRM|nr:hypothetical protein [Pelotomaculum propionicicum]TEB12022.1 hypothetical protein Pmgp_01178 [Pelotomaculum propionicicum]
MGIIMKYALAWVGLVIIAILNGGVREKWYRPHMGELTAHQLSTLTGIMLFGVYIWILTGIWIIGSAGQAFAIGGVWVVLTIVFEFIFGHYVMKHSWDDLLYNYNLLKGRLWVLVLVWTLLAPYVFYSLHS